MTFPSNVESLVEDLETEELQVAHVVPLDDADRTNCQQTARVVESEVLSRLRAIQGMDELRLAGRSKIQSSLKTNCYCG